MDYIVANDEIHVLICRTIAHSHGEDLREDKDCKDRACDEDCPFISQN